MSEEDNLTLSSNKNEDEDEEAPDSETSDSNSNGLSSQEPNSSSETTLSTKTLATNQKSLSFQLRPSRLQENKSPPMLQPYNSLLKPPKITITTEPTLTTNTFLRPSKLLPPIVTTSVSASVSEKECTSSKSSDVTFVPLSNNNAAEGDGGGSISSEKIEEKKNGHESSTFLFGQNLSERGVVVKENVKSDVTNQVNNEEPPEEGNNDESSCAKKRKLEPIVTTGEEDDINVLQINCRLYSFEGGSWLERVSRGVLRLNDFEDESSRLIVRSQGSLRLMLNTKLWSEMVVERPNDKSIKFTGMDDALKIFLVMASPGEIDMLHAALKSRLNNFKRSKSD